MDNAIASLLGNRRQEIIDDWVGRQMSVLSPRGAIKEGELRQQSGSFLDNLAEALRRGGAEQFDSESFAEVRRSLESLSRSRAQQGFTPTETATFVLSLRQTLFEIVRSGGAESVDGFWSVNALIDRMALFTMDAFLAGREEVISRQQQELLELSTPVVELWDGVLALPLIGTLDSNRTQVVMESLLEKIVETGAPISIIDITGVPYVDTLVAQHLLKTIAAARLMGAECVISGIRPQIAQTIVHLGVDLEGVTTKATLADALTLALSRVGARVVKDQV